MTLRSPPPRLSPRTQVVRDFRAPDGVSPDDVDANGDGEVLAVLNLQVGVDLYPDIYLCVWIRRI